MTTEVQHTEKCTFAEYGVCNCYPLLRREALDNGMPEGADVEQFVAFTIMQDLLHAVMQKAMTHIVERDAVGKSPQEKLAYAVEVAKKIPQIMFDMGLSMALTQPEWARAWRTLVNPDQTDESDSEQLSLLYESLPVHKPDEWHKKMMLVEEKLTNSVDVNALWEEAK